MREKIMQNTRQRILDVAGSLFFRYGYRAVGVDTIVKETGIAKMTLYRHFPSKDDLIAAYLEQVDGLMQEWLDSSVKPYEGSPHEQLLAIFEALQKLIQSPQCYGCAFLITAVEFPDLDSVGHKAALAHKQSVRARFENLAEQAGINQPGRLADQLLLLMDGAFASVRMFGIENPGANVANAAALLIDGHIRQALG